MTVGHRVAPVVRAVGVAVRCAAAAAVVPRLVRTAIAQLGRAPTDPAVDRTSNGAAPTITVVVPARDEAERIVALMKALADSPGVGEVVVVDDRSGDDTAAVALRHGPPGLRVVRGEPLPSGWAGKAWALDQGVRAATGDWVVCLDADTRPDPGLPRWLVARATGEGLDLVSVSGLADLPPAARWLHAAMLTTLVYRFGGPGAGAAGRELANGQCLAFRRAALLDEGGLAPVAGAVTEDVALARHLARRGWSVAMVDAADRLIVESYGSLPEVWRGWGRSIGMPGVEPTRRVAFDSVALTMTMPLPVLRLVRGMADGLDLALIAVRLGTLAGTRRAYRSGGVAYWSSPLADAAAVASVAVSPLRRSVRWRRRRLAVVR